MVIFLLLLGFIAVAAGIFSAGQGIPARDTTFGAAMLVAASVAITGGFILLGLAAAVSELRRALRHLRLPDRGDGERGQGAGRRKEPRIDRPAAHSPDATHVIPTRFDAPQAADEREARVREPHLKPAAPERLDTIRPADYRRPGTEASWPEANGPSGAEPAADEVRSPPLAPAEAAASVPAALRPPRALKSGTINNVAYTLFSDGSIETTTPQGTLRFDSIDEFRQHLEKSTG
jgi:hypothetical protein